MHSAAVRDSEQSTYHCRAGCQMSAATPCNFPRARFTPARVHPEINGRVRHASLNFQIFKCEVHTGGMRRIRAARSCGADSVWRHDYSDPGDSIC